MSGYTSGAETRGRYLARQRRARTGLNQPMFAETVPMGLDWLKKIETDRARDLSPELVEAIADALQLEGMERLFWTRLNQRRSAPGKGLVAATVEPDYSDLEFLEVLADRFDDSMAVALQTPWFDILACTPLYERIHPGVRAGTNLLEWMLFDPISRECMIEHAAALQLAVSFFRMKWTVYGEMTRAQEVYESCSRSTEFNRMWSNQGDLIEAKLPRTRVLMRDSAGVYQLAVRFLDNSDLRRPWTMYWAVPMRTPAEPLTLDA